MHVYTCDYTEAGSVIFIGGSTSSMDGVELPQRLDGWGADRMEIRGTTRVHQKRQALHPCHKAQKPNTRPENQNSTPAAEACYTPGRLAPPPQRAIPCSRPNGLCPPDMPTDFRAQCSIISTRSCGLKVICTIDPKAHLPQSLLNFCIKVQNSPTHTQSEALHPLANMYLKISALASCMDLLAENRGHVDLPAGAGGTQDELQRGHAPPGHPHP